MTLLCGLLVGLLLCLAGCSPFAHQEPESSSIVQLELLYRDVWQADLEADPVLATRVGEEVGQDRLGDVTPAAWARRLSQLRGFHERLSAIDRARLSEPAQINYDFLARLLDDRIVEIELGSHRIPITNRAGFHIDFAQLPEITPFESANDYEAYTARLRAFGPWVEQHIALMREGLKTGWTLPQVVLEGYDETIAAHVVERPEESRLYAPFERFLERIDPAEQEALRREGRQAIAEVVVPAYRRFLIFMREEYRPGARETIAASDLPDGRAFYEHRVRHFTTLDFSPEAIHELGRDEVRRIHEEMQAVIERVEFEGSFVELLELLRTDQRFVASTPEELLARAAWICKRMDGQLPQLFGRLPRMPYGITPVPDFIAPKTTTAYYQRPAGDGSRAGTYFVNTYDLASRPLYELEALSLHEAVPGHHLQIALQQELEQLPKLRRFHGATAFVEGWALYAERLGLEVGFYEDPYSDFGRLTFEMWRACRLVVDTGIHALGWTRQQAIDFMAENTALSLHNIDTEVDRYIAWPGQALAYKMGELKIRELRELAERELGEAFDRRDFHDVVLGSGAVSLDVLEELVEAYISETLARGAPAADGGTFRE